MNIKLDTCSFIHLSQGGVLDVVLALQGDLFFMGPITRGEVVQLKAIIDLCIDERRIVVLPDDELAFDAVADFSDEYNIGLGESECILFCMNQDGLNICSDDKRARLIATNILTPKRVLGTSDLLIACIRQGLLTPQDAFAAYELMRARGAFLPQLPRQHFII